MYINPMELLQCVRAPCSVLALKPIPVPGIRYHVLGFLTQPIDVASESNGIMLHVAEQGESDVVNIVYCLYAVDMGCQ